MGENKKVSFWKKDKFRISAVVSVVMVLFVLIFGQKFLENISIGFKEANLGEVNKSYDQLKETMGSKDKENDTNYRGMPKVTGSRDTAGVSQNNNNYQSKRAEEEKRTIDSLETPQIGYQWYADNFRKFAFSYPKDWVKVWDVDKVVKFESPYENSDEQKAEVSLTIKGKKRDQTESEYLQWGLDLVEANGFTNINVEQMVVGTNSWQLVGYEDLRSKFKFLQAYVIRDDRVFTLVLNAPLEEFDAYASYLREAVKTFKFLE